jgi:hypothetical protein
VPQPLAISRRPAALAVLALLLGAAALPGLAAADSSPHPVKTGFYSSLVGVRSSDVEFHVRSHSRIPDLALVCAPVDPSQSTTTVDIAIHPPALHLSGGRISYDGPATITGAYAGAPKITTTTLTIRGHHVNGPVHHYTFEGRHLTQTTAFEGNAASPACTALPRGGAFTLFGPVPGE